MKSRAYRAVDVNGIDIGALVKSRVESVVHAGLDIGKELIYCVLRWGSDDFDRPWLVRNPIEVGTLAALLREVGRGRTLVAAMEPTGTYGDALRQALQRAEVAVHRVSPKNAKDYAEVFDGVPSQHDGKDAAVIADLSAQGRSWPWPLAQPTLMEQELAYHVDWMDAQRRQKMMWCGRVEALLSRHWPEATAIVSLTKTTMLQCLAVHGGPRGLAAASDALEQVKSWSRQRLSDEKAKALVESARQTQGLEMGQWDEERLRRCAREIQDCREQIEQSKQRLHAMTRDHVKIRAMSGVVGVATACVLWSELGDPAAYSCGPAYRKGMGLNLAERSSGKWKGALKISKRGSSKIRRWMYMAALRWVKSEPVRSWYLAQKAARRGEGKPAVIGVMRKLASALYRVGGRGETFDANCLYQSLVQAAK